MTDTAARSLFFDLSWDIETKKLTEANRMTDSLKTNANDMFKDTDKASKSLSTSGSTIAKQFKTAGKSVDLAGDKIADADKVTGQLMETAEDVANEVEKIGDSADKSSKKVDKLEGSTKKLALAKKGLVAVGGAIVALGGFAIAAGLKIDSLDKDLAMQTGATGEELEALRKSFQEIGKSSSKDLSAVNETVIATTKSLGLQGDELEVYSSKILNLGPAIEDNFSGFTEAHGKMASAWKMNGEEAAKSLDIMYVASRKTKLGMDEFSEILTEFGPSLELFGYDFEESAALLASFEQSGYKGEQMIDALKGTMEKMASEGITDFAGGLDDIVNKLKSFKSDSEAAAWASENLSGEAVFLADAVRSGAMDIQDFVKDLEQAPGAINEAAKSTETFEDKLNRFKNNATLSLAPIAGQMLDVFGDVLENITPMVQSIFETVGPIFEKLGPIIGELVEQMMPIVDLIMEVAQLILPPLIDLLMVVIQKIMPPVIDAVRLLVMVLRPVITLLFDIVQVVIPPVINIVSKLAGIIVDVLGVAFNNIGTTISIAMGVFKGFITFISGVFTGDWKKAWQGVKDIFSSIVSGFANIFKTPINFIIKGINDFIGGLNNVKIPDWVPVVGGKGFSIDLIPQLAKGTDFFDGGLSIVGEAGPELVTLPTGSGVMPNDQTERLLTRTVSNNNGDTYTIENNIEIEVNADGSDEAAIERLRGELKTEIPRALEKAFKKIYLKNKPA